jgi:hypothetical protein
MEDIRDVFVELQQRADELGVYLKPPVTSSKLLEWRKQLDSDIVIEVPDGYLMLLSLSNGVETQQGWIYDAHSFLEQNYRRWNCDTRVKSTPEGCAIEFPPLAIPRDPEYAWLGAYGNMDMYLFDFRSREYRATSLGDQNYIWFSSPTLGGLLRYMAMGQLSDPPAM